MSGSRSLYSLLVVLVLVLGSALGAQSPITPTGTLLFNGIEMQLRPYVQTKNAEYDYANLEFSRTCHSYPDSCVISFSHPDMSFGISLSPRYGLGAEAWQVRITTQYHTALQIRDFHLYVDFLSATPQAIYRGPEAIATQDPSLNSGLVPYRDKALQYAFNDTSLWIVASNYEGCSNVEILKENAICLYDHTAHLARLYNPDNGQFTAMIDCLQRQAGESDEWSFLLFTQQPVLLSINRWLGRHKAALSITNDADGEADRKMQAVYYGSNNPQSPKYMTTGLVANDIKVTNTVFGASEPLLGYLWHQLKELGYTIGYHSYSNFGDLSADTYNNITGVMQQYNVRTWIDHSWVTNPEALCYQGFDPESPYYQLHAINDSQVDYYWVGDNLSINPFNSFDEPGFLPHRLSAFTGLTRPLWFFGRTKMQSWENKGYSYQVDMKHNLTPENLDALLKAKGLCVVYTHFFFDESATIGAFFEYKNGFCEVKDEVNERFAMLDHYQKNRGLWVDTLENVFDRMIAIEDLKITGVETTRSGELLRIRLANQSSYPLEQLYMTYQDQEIEIPLIPAQSHEDIILSGTSSAVPAYDLLTLKYKENALYIQRKDKSQIMPMSIAIYNLRGQKVSAYQWDQSTDEVIMPLPSCPSGVYLARLHSTKGQQQTRKFYILK